MIPVVHIASFGYHRSGIPADPHGHGGFVIDCRCLPNPVYEADLAMQSGLDADVVDYFHGFPTVSEFISATAELVDIAVRVYRERGYDRLAVSFGCTGGQHRSVYCAERLAGYLRDTGVAVEVEHVERGAWW